MIRGQLLRETYQLESEVVSPDTIDPELLGKEFGPFTTYLREDYIPHTRVWVFSNPIMTRKFRMMGNLPRFKRKKEENG